MRFAPVVLAAALLVVACEAGRSPDAGVTTDGGLAVDGAVDAGHALDDAGAVDGGGEADAGGADAGDTDGGSQVPSVRWRPLPIHYCRPTSPFTLALGAFVESTAAPTFRIVSGGLPPGLSMQSSGVIAGAPTQAGRFTARVEASSSGVGATADVELGCDDVGPSIPALSAVVRGPREVALSWSASTDDLSGVAGYRVLRDGQRLTFVTGWQYDDLTVSPATTATYQLECFDAVGNRSGLSAPVQVTTPGLDAGQLADAGSGAGDAGVSTFGPPPAPRVTTCSRYVSPTGDDTATGLSIDAAWRTLARANQGAQPGLTLCLRAGTYVGPVRPAASGTSAAPIRYVAHDREPVVVRGGGSPAVDLDGLSFVSVEAIDLEATQTSTTPVARLDFSTGCTLAHARVTPLANTFSFSGPRTIGVSVEGSTGALVHACTLTGFGHAVIASRSTRLRVISNLVTNSFGNGIVIAEGNQAIRGVLIEGNVFANSLTSDGVQTDDYGPNQQTVVAVRGVVVRRNVFLFNAENAIDLKAAGDVVVEENLIAGGAGDNDGTGFLTETEWWRQRGQPAVMHGSGRTAGRALIRRNVFFDNGAGVLQAEDGWHVFNNTFVNDNRDAFGSNSTWVGPEPFFVGVTLTNVRGDVFNNIVVNHGHGAMWFWGALLAFGSITTCTSSPRAHRGSSFARQASTGAGPCNSSSIIRCSVRSCPRGWSAGKPTASSPIPGS